MGGRGVDSDICRILEPLHAFAWSHLLGNHQMMGSKIQVKAAMWHDSSRPIYLMCKYWVCLRISYTPNLSKFIMYIKTGK